MTNRELHLNTPYLSGLEKENVHRKSVTIELFLWTLGAAGIALVLSGNEQGELLVTVPLGILGVFYFFSAFNLYGRKEADEKAAIQGVKVFISKMVFWGSSIAVFGILYTIAAYEGADTMLIIGMSTMMLLLLAMIITNLKPGDKMQFHVITFARIVLLIALTALLSFGTDASPEQINSLLG